jgi:ribonuclease R
MNKEMNYIPSRRELFLGLNDPKSISELVESQFPNAHEKATAGRIEAMLRDGQITGSGKGTYRSITDNLQEGTISAHPKGFGFVITNNENKWFLKEDDMQNLFDGDIVLASPKTSDPKGTSATIIKRHFESRTVAATFIAKVDDTFAFSYAGKTFEASVLGDMPIVPGALCTGYLTADTSGIEFKFEITKIDNEPHPVDAIRLRRLQEKGFAPYHSDEATNEALTLCVQTPVVDIDMRDIPLISIDGATSQDLDDIVGGEERADGTYRLVVAISDVSTVIPKDSLIDRLLMDSTTSVYVAGRCYNMVPKTIAHNMCSMLPNADRNSLVCDMELNSEGKLVRYRFVEAQVRSMGRFTYKRVDELLINNDLPKNSIEHKALPMLKTLEKITHLRSTCKKERGGLVIDRSERCVSFDENGEVFGFGQSEKYFSNTLIEEAMVLANVAAAMYLTDSKGYGLFRHHPGLQEKGLNELNSLLTYYDLPSLTTESSTKDCQTLREKLGENTAEYDRLLRQCMTNARYHAVSSDHFGMSLKYYTHFTSPIRRAADIVVHRMIKWQLQLEGYHVHGAADYTLEELIAIGEHITEKSYHADLVERNVMDDFVCRKLSRDGIESAVGTIATINDKMIFLTLEDAPIDVALFKEDYMRHTDEPPKIGDVLNLNIININEAQGRIRVGLKTD